LESLNPEILVLTSEVCLLNLLGSTSEVGRGALQRDPAMLQDNGTVRKLECLLDVLLDQDDRYAVFICIAAQRYEKAVDDQWAEAKGQLVGK